jgi:serine acetyltransferase
MTRIVLFGSGSPVIVDVEETCRRLGLRVAAVVRNVEGPEYSALPDRILPVSLLTAALLALPHAIPLFSPANRRAALGEAMALGARHFPPLLDPSSVLPSSLAVEDGVYLNAGCVLGAASRLGRFAFVNRGCALGHHLVLEAFASIGPGVVAAGQVSVGEAASIGAGAVLAPGVRIGAGATVCAGSVVVRDVAAGVTVAGNPARLVRRG